MTNTSNPQNETSRTSAPRRWARRRQAATLTLAVAASLASTHRAGAEDPEPAAGAAKIKVLLVDGQNNHDWKGCGPVMINTLEATSRFEVEREIVTKPRTAEFNPDFTKYDVILTNYNGMSWPEETKKNFVKYIEEGGYMAVVHAADNSFPDWKEYNEMIGLGG